MAAGLCIGLLLPVGLLHGWRYAKLAARFPGRLQLAGLQLGYHGPVELGLSLYQSLLTAMLRLER